MTSADTLAMVTPTQKSTPLRNQGARTTNRRSKVTFLVYLRTSPLVANGSLTISLVLRTVFGFNERIFGSFITSIFLGYYEHCLLIINFGLIYILWTD